MVLLHALFSFFPQRSGRDPRPERCGKNEKRASRVASCDPFVRGRQPLCSFMLPHTDPLGYGSRAKSNQGHVPAGEF